MKIELYTKENCSYCDKAKNLLEQKSLAYTSYKLNEEYTRDELIEKFPSARSFPVIVIDDVYIGGFTQLEKVLENE